MKINFKRNLLLKILSLSICMFLILGTSTAFAFDQDFTVGKSFTWSPIVENIYVGSGVNQYLYTNCYFHFDAAGASSNNNWLYFTFEENNVADGLEGDSRYSNIPDPHFDWDDDNGDGYEEESEVVEGGNSLQADYQYYFTTWWVNTKSTNHSGGTINYIAQNSVWNPFNGEYEAFNYDLLQTRNFSTIYKP